MDGIKLYNQFLALHKPQLESSAVPSHLWESLYRKVNSETFDASSVFQLMLIEYDDEGDGDGDDADKTEENVEAAASNAAKDCRPVFTLCVAAENGIRVNDPQAIYLIDHAWTFRLSMARSQLQQHDQLTNRLCVIMNVDMEDEQRVDKVLTRMWRYIQCYSVSVSNDGGALNDEARSPIWYIMDEVGSAVSHSDEPNFRLVPFLHLNTQTTYSLLFPVRDCESGETITRDFVEYVPKESSERTAFLLPWRYADLREHSITQAEPSSEYFTSGHITESYPQDLDVDAHQPQVNRNEPLKVYAEYDIVRQHLTAPEFQLVDDENEADVLWLTRHYKTFAELHHDTPNKFVNQFPFEYVITIKDLLSITCRRAIKEHSNAETLQTFPAWLPTTYNLKTELLAFVSYYQQRAAKGLDNHWIIKPWNLARGLDMYITSDIVQILRLPITGPKIAQKYIERPALFYRPELDAKVKFDIRYVILLKNVRPLEAYVHRKFFLRFANRAFELDRFDEYERHFTVMNYHEEAQLRHIKCEEFIGLWQQQNPQFEWSKVEDDICVMLHEMLLCATEQARPPCAIAKCPQSRAVYAADIMLEWCEDETQVQRLQPKLLEVNWTPDCKRACDYYANFFNDIFKLLFLNEHNDETFRMLSPSNLA